MDCCQSLSLPKYLRHLVPLLLLCAILSPGQQSISHTLVTLSGLRDTKRVLLVFAPSSDDPNFAMQRSLFKNQASEASDRDLIFIPFLGRQKAADIELRDENTSLTPDAEQIRLRSRYKIKPNDFAVILLGKDGGEKLRSGTPVTMEKLATLIDSMPMRQQEVRQRKP